MIPLDRVRELLAAMHSTDLQELAREEPDWTDLCAEAGPVDLFIAAPDLARDVLTLADALATAERERDRLTACLARASATIEETERARYAADDERDTARSALDGLTAAVRAEREAERGHAAVRADDASRGRHLRAAEAAVDKARHATDALISAAPAPTTVPATVVRAYLRADARSATGTHADATALAAARAALDAALARCV